MAFFEWTNDDVVGWLQDYKSKRLKPSQVVAYIEGVYGLRLDVRTVYRRAQQVEAEQNEQPLELI
jgi:hypothetical protein